MLLTTVLGFAFCALAIPLERRQAPSEVPVYVLQYAPVVYLHSSDPYRPADIGSQLVNTQPELNYTSIKGAPHPPTLENLNDFNILGGIDVYLTSKDNVADNPVWMNGVTPDNNGKTNDSVSCAIIINDHGSGLVDAFYMYFYAFDQGGTYFGMNIGNHVGDWEHNMVRFKDGEPYAIWYSQHSNGEAFYYDTVLKYDGGVRPVCYSAKNTHANYAISGNHGYGIPNVNLPVGLLNDSTDDGPLWDPTLSAYFYKYDAGSQEFSAYDDSTPVNWLYFDGSWGDEQYPDSDPRQQSIFGIDGLYKYVSGPPGPVSKQLNRTHVCPDDGDLCIVRSLLSP